MDRTHIRPATDGVEQRLDALLDGVQELIDAVNRSDVRPESSRSAPEVREEPLREPVESPKTEKSWVFKTEEPTSTAKKSGKKS